MRTNWIRMIAVVAMVAAAGCGKKSGEKVTDKMIEKAIEKNSDGKASVDLNDGKMTVTTKDGTVTMDASGGASIPENFPKDVAVPASTKVVYAASTPDAVALTLDGPKDVAAAVKSFSDDMKAKGWSEEATYNMSGQMGVTFKKGERTAVFSATGAGEKSVITLTAMLAK